MQLRHRLRKLLIMATTMSARPRWTSLPSGPMSPMKHCSRTMPDLTPHTSKSSGSSPRTASTWRTTLDFHSGRSPITTKKARRDPLKFRAMLTSAQYSTWKWSSTSASRTTAQQRRQISRMWGEWSKPSMLSSGIVTRSALSKQSLSGGCSQYRTYRSEIMLCVPPRHRN